MEKMENLATMNEKSDAVTHSSDEALEEGSVETAHTSLEEKTDAEKRLVRKIDLYLMPTIWIPYCFSYMVCCSNYSQHKRASLTPRQDRTAIGNAKVARMDVDLRLTSNDYFLAIVILQLGYVFFQVPSK